MFDFHALEQSLNSLGLRHWNDEIGPLLRERLTGKTHGDWRRWNEVISDLPAARGDAARLYELLMGLHPWRKGPLSLDGVEIDTEWRSDWKWARVKDGIAPLEGRNVLDVGSGNGYYACYAVPGDQRIRTGRRDLHTALPARRNTTSQKGLRYDLFDGSPLSPARPA
jgi:tRNA (mo5U34)-methyltransferase